MASLKQPPLPAVTLTPPIQVFRGEVRFDNVVFGYNPVNPVLKGVSFLVPGVGCGVCEHVFLGGPYVPVMGARERSKGMESTGSTLPHISTFAPPPPLPDRRQDSGSGRRHR